MIDDMMSRLSEYVDGTLQPAERGQVDAWLKEHVEGREVVIELERVKTRALTLPMRSVPESVWSGVKAGIRDGRAARRTTGAGERRVSFSLVQLAAAAAVLVVLGAGGAAWTLRGRTQPNGVRSGPTGGLGEAAGVGPGTSQTIAYAPKADRTYDHAINDLQRVVMEQQAQLSPTTVKVIQQNLVRIDSALVQAQQALEHDPRNPYLNDHVAQMKQRKLKLLRQTASLLRAS